MYNLPIAVYSRNPPKPPPPGGNYWRINITAVNAYCAVSEMIMATTKGGPTVTTGGSPISGSNLGGYPASLAFDGVTSDPSSWISGNSGSGWLGYHFATNVAIVEIRMTQRPAGSGQSPRDFQIQRSNDGVI